MSNDWPTRLLKELNNAMNSERNEARAHRIFMVNFALNIWLQEQSGGPPPISLEQLQQLDLTLPPNLLSDIRAALSVSEPQPAPTADTTAAIPVVEPVEPSQPAAAPASTVPALQERFDAASRLLAGGNILQALKLLRELEPQTSGELQVSVRNELQKATAQQRQREQDVLLRTRQAVEQQRGDLDQQRIIWREVLAVAEEHSDVSREATHELSELERRQQRGGRVGEVEQQLSQYSQELALARGQQSIRRIQELIPQIEALRDPLLPPVLAEQIVQVRLKAQEDLNQLREATGTASTLLQFGNLQAAYLEARKFADQGLPEVWDSQLGGMRPTSEVLSEATEKLLELRLAKAVEYQERAERARSSSTPREVVGLYQDALAFLNYLTLQTEQRDGLEHVVGGEGSLDTIDAKQRLTELRKSFGLKLEESQALLERWNHGNRLFQAAEREPDPEQALGLLEQVRGLSAEEPDLRFYGLESAIKRREEDLSVSLAVQIENANIEAEAAADAGDFVTARRLLIEARPLTTKVRSPSKQLQTATAQLGQMLKTVQERSRRTGEVKELVDLAQQALGLSSPDLEHVRDLLDQLTEAERRLPRVLEIQRRLSSLQGESDNWASAQRAYREANWTLALETCNLLSSQGRQFQQQAARLGGRAQAMQVLESARQARRGRPARLEQARDAYRLVVGLLEQHGTDDQTQPALEEASQAVRELEALDRADVEIAPQIVALRSQLELVLHDIQSPSTTFTLASRGEWKALLRQLDPLLTRPSSFQSELDTLRRQALEGWRSDYLSRLRQAPRDPSTLPQMYRLVEELQAEGLLWNPSEQHLGLEIELQSKLQQADGLRKQQRPNWAKIIELEQRVSALVQMGYAPIGAAVPSELDMEQRLLEARQAQVSSEIQQYLARNDLQGAVQYLEQLLESEVLSTDASLTVELITLLQRQRSFERAYQRARSLRFSTNPAIAQQSALWVDMTRAAELLAQGEYAEALYQIDYITAKHPGAKDLWSDLLDEQVEQTINLLLSQAHESERRSPEVLSVIQYYAQARMILEKIGREDPRVDRGLSKLGGAISRELEATCRRAAELRLANRTPAAVIKDARLLRDRLRAIQQVQEQLRVEPEQRLLLDNTLEELETKLARWEQFTQHIQQAQELLEQARQESWDFSEARRLLQAARADNEFRPLTAPVLRTIDSYEQWVQEFRQLAEELDKSIRMDLFDATIATCDQISNRWKQMQRELDLPLDERGLRWMPELQHVYPGSEQRVDEIRIHRQKAEQRRNNYEMWRDHAQILTVANNNLRTAFEEICNEQDIPTISLHEMSVAIDRFLRDCSQLEQMLADSEKLPIAESLKATQEEDKARRVQRINRGQRDIDNWKGEINKLRQTIQAKLERFKEIMDEVEQWLRDSHRPHTRRNNDLIEQKLNEAAQLDQHEAQRLRSALEDLKQRRAQENNPRPSGWFRG